MTSALRLIGPGSYLPEGRALSKSTETLADFVRRTRLAKGLSCADVEKQSARGGRKISGAHVNRIENGQARQVGPEGLQALARGLGVPLDEIWSRVTGKMPTDPNKADEERLVMMFRELPAEKRADFLKMLEAIYSGGGSRKRHTA
jgi:transcriptional regulator with XRE-family HTH domain